MKGFDFIPKAGVSFHIYVFNYCFWAIVKTSYSSINKSYESRMCVYASTNLISKSKLVEPRLEHITQNDVSWNFYSAPYIRWIIPHTHTHARHKSRRKNEPSARCIGRIWYVCTYSVGNIFQGEILESTTTTTKIGLSAHLYKHPPIALR